MDLSVVILSYNVKYLLDACIQSVILATKKITYEIIVIDNASTDESVQMVKHKFSQVKIIKNDKNLGFAKANNLAAKSAIGKYLLILNPDTIINESAIITCIEHLMHHRDTGLVGVRMVDQSGNYLPESKRGFPDLISSFFKVTGIYRLFPKTDFFNHYYLGSKDKNLQSEVDVLTGAYMMMPKSVFELIGGFDENYFMYGEDIDLCTRVKKAGKKLIYIGEEQIIHLKGRSARFDSYQHVKNFYQAMSIFVNKNYTSSFVRWILHLSIAIAGSLSYIKRKIISHIIPLIDLVLIVLAIGIIKYLWGYYWFGDSNYFNHFIFYANVVGYVGIWMISLFYFSTYHPVRLRHNENTIKAIWLATGLILIIYSLLPEQMRSSRSVIVLSSVLLTFLLPLFRKWISIKPGARRAIFIGEATQENKYHELFYNLNYKNLFSYFSIAPNDIKELGLKCKSENITTVLIDPTQYTTDELLKIYSYIPKKIDILHLQTIGKSPTLVEGNLALSMMQNKILKWLLNLVLSIFILPFGWLNKKIRRNYLDLLTGKKYWVGYHEPMQEHLPFRKSGLLTPQENLTIKQTVSDLNFDYARDYSALYDLKILLSRMI